MTSNDRADCVAQLHEALRLVRAWVPQGDQVCVCIPARLFVGREGREGALDPDYPRIILGKETWRRGLSETVARWMALDGEIYSRRLLNSLVNN